MISEVTRRDILDYLFLPETPGLFGRLEAVEFLDRIFKVKSAKVKWGGDSTMADEIWQHYVRNDDWPLYYLFNDYLDILNVPDEVFIDFICLILHPAVRKTRQEAEEMAAVINAYLKHAGCCVREMDTVGGRPVYESVPNATVAKATNAALSPNYRLVAVDLASKAKDRHTYAKLSLLASAVFDFEKVEHPREEFTSSKAQLVYDWIMTLAESDMPETSKREKLAEFSESLVGDDAVLGMPILEPPPHAVNTALPAFDIVSLGDEEPKQTQVQTKSDSVFVIHGRDERARKAMFEFLRALHLKPVEWSHAVAASGAASPFIGDVIDHALNQAQAVVVLFTGDDNAGLRPALHSRTDGQDERRLQPQPRPNVLFEAGMAYGRVPERTVIVEIGRIRPISDLAGRHAIRMDNSAAKRNALAQRLKQAGCPVNTVGDDWLTTGDFADILEA